MDYEKERKLAEQYAEKRRLKNEISEIKHKNDKKLTFSKWAFIFMMVNCTVIEIFSMVTMFMFVDLSPLPSLIAAVVGECILCVSYMAKSAIENRKDGIIYEMAMRDNESEG